MKRRELFHASLGAACLTAHAIHRGYADPAYFMYEAYRVMPQAK
ncbi:hypothetical protein [Prosthecobacter sp.]|jgi:hypothetical protein|nr:hypothetical protein [Prosthecobacter sp.]